MAFSLFGKRTPDSETTDEGKDPDARVASPGEARLLRPHAAGGHPHARLVLRVDRLGARLTREIDETSLAELEAVLLAADIGAADRADHHREPAPARTAAGDRGRRRAEAAAEDRAEAGARRRGDARMSCPTSRPKWS